MAIPNNITRDHVLLAIKKVITENVPKRRGIRNWAVLHEGKHYPCKLLISWANIFANGEELDPNPNVFQVKMARDYLTKLGFTIVRIKK